MGEDEDPDNVRVDLTFFLAMFIIGFIVFVFFSQAGGETEANAALIYLLMLFFGLLGLGLDYIALPGARYVGIGDKKDFEAIALLFGGLLFGFFAATGIKSLIANAFSELFRSSGAAAGNAILPGVRFLLVNVLAPFAEEPLFRGFLGPTFQRLMLDEDGSNEIIAFIGGNSIQAAVFAGVHLFLATVMLSTQNVPVIDTLVSQFIWGWLMGLIVYLTGSLLAALAAHFALNIVFNPLAPIVGQAANSGVQAAAAAVQPMMQLAAAPTRFMLAVAGFPVV